MLRVLVLKQMTGFSYKQLAFHLEDSFTYRRFCLLGIDATAPSASTLQTNIKRVRPQTLEWLHHRLIRQAVAMGVEDGTVVRVDSEAKAAALGAVFQQLELIVGQRIWPERPLSR